MAKFKRIGVTLAACALTAAVAVGGTIAYLSAVTGTKENKFTSSKGLTGELTETDWKYDGSSWSDYTPGDSTGKNPVIVIDDKGVDAYVAIKVECVDGEGNKISFADFKKDYATVSYNGTEGINGNWTQVDGKDFYVYNEIVKSNSSTEPLFDKVTVNTGIVRAYTVTTGQETVTTYKTDENGEKIPSTKEVKVGDVVVFDENTTILIKNADGTTTEVSAQNANLPSFQINVTGYAVQKSGNEDIYTTELTKLAGLK